MGSLRPISWRTFHNFLISIDCHFVREKGDHRVYWKSGILRPIILPRYDELPIFIILNNLRTLNISKEHFVQWLKKGKAVL